MEEIIRVNEEFYILAKTALIQEPTHVLKRGETFGMFDRYGDVQRLGTGEQGLYHEGTRFLSRSVFYLNGTERPLLLSSTVKEDNALLTVNLTNADVSRDGKVLVPHGSVHLLRSKLLLEGACYEQLVIRNYGQHPVQLSCAMQFEADFADIFEVRGVRRSQRGTVHEPLFKDHAVSLPYRGLDGVLRRLRVVCLPAPQRISSTDLWLDVRLPPGGEAQYSLTYFCECRKPAGRRLSFSRAHDLAYEALRDTKGAYAQITSSNEQFNDWVQRSLDDLCMMATQTPYGVYPYAGVPWFNTPFGRDGIITALECAWINPSLARGVLSYLAATQATAISADQDAEPGKILHEARLGEMAALKEIPFGRYYGSVDATPLFVILAGVYYERTADREFIHQLWPALERALQWIDRYGDRDRDGFVEYVRRTPAGLANQGWKDSHDAVFHRDGSLAEGPIALCEVQAYVYAAKRRAASLARVLGRAPQAERLDREASELQERFEQRFWIPEYQTYAVALDGNKRPCKVRTSNAGHCLFAGIVSAQRARQVAQHLLSPDCYSGWGIRTVSTAEPRYNPMSYHNGSVWPHDNALIASGLAAYGLKDQTLTVFSGLFDASMFVDLHRLPELFCGFVRTPGEAPTLYPVACAPQAWSSGAAFLLLQACLGLTIDAPKRLIRFMHPVLPSSLREVYIHHLRIAGASLDLWIQRHPEDVGINVMRRTGEIRVEVVK